MSSSGNSSEPEKIDSLFEKMGLPNLSVLASSEDMLDFYNVVLDKLGGGVALAKNMARAIEEEIEAGGNPDLDPIATEARDRVINLSRGFFEAARTGGSPVIAAWFGAALAFAVVQFESLVEGLARDVDTADRARKGLLRGPRSRRAADSGRDEEIRKKMDVLYAAGYSGRAAANELAPKYNLMADTIRKKFKK